MALTGIRLRVISLVLGAFASWSCQTVQDNAANPSATRVEDLITTQLQLVQQQIDNGTPDNGLMILKSLQKSYPGRPDIINMYGIIYLSMNNPGKSIKYFNESYKINPTTSSRLNLSSAYIATGQFKKAREILKPVLADSTYDFRERIFHNYALSFEREKNLVKALLYYDRAVQENPSYYLSYLRIGEIQHSRHQDAKALEAYQKALQFCNICYEAVNGLSQVLISQAQVGRAIEVLQTYVRNKKVNNRDRRQAYSLMQVAEKIRERKG